MNILNHFLGVGGGEQDGLGLELVVLHVLAQNFDAEVIRLLQEYFIRLVVNHHLEILQIHLFAAFDSLLQPLWDCHQDLLSGLLRRLLVTDCYPNGRILDEFGQNLLNLPYQFPSVCNDDYLDGLDFRVNRDNGGDAESEGLATAVAGVEQEVVLPALQNFGNGVRLNLRRPVHLEIEQPILEELRHLQIVPRFAFVLQVLHDVLEL